LKKISIGLAVYNGSSFIKEQIDSMLPQLTQQDEIIVSDDGSTDDTLAILRSYSDSRIRILPHERSRGVTGNFEYVLSHCSGDVIFLSDQDDFWLPQKIKWMASALETCDLVVCDCCLVDEHRNKIASSFYKQNKSGKGLIKNLLRNSFMGCCMAFTQKVLSKALPFPASIAMHDQWIGLVAQRYFTVRFISEVLVEHRLHPHNHSSTGIRSTIPWNKKMRSRIYMAGNLLTR
jgi:GT2 family glycosyltransferase